MAGVLGEVANVLESAHIPYAVIGQPRWTHDIDILILPQDAERVLIALALNAFRTEPEHDGLHRASKYGVMVDVISRVRDRSRGLPPPDDDPTRSS